MVKAGYNLFVIYIASKYNFIVMGGVWVYLVEMFSDIKYLVVKILYIIFSGNSYAFFLGFL